MKFIIAFLMSVTAAQAQWVTVAAPGQIVTIPIGTYVRWGSVADNLFILKPYITTQTYRVGGGQFPTSPDPKANPSTFVLQVYQQPVAQTVTVSGKAVVVPAAGPVTPPNLSVTATYNCTIQVFSDGTFSSTSCTAAQ